VREHRETLTGVWWEHRRVDQKLPRWPVPGYYGTADAVQQMGTVAAPLLAGFAITVATLVVTSADSLRWPGACLLAAVAAAAVLLISVQLTFWARQALLTPDNAREWWDDLDTPDGREARIREMEGFNEVRRWYEAGAGLTYDAGIVLLLLALAFLLLPTADARQAGLRWAGVGLAGLAVLVELLWTVLKRLDTRTPAPLRPLARWLIRKPADYMKDG
jgi:hypothetical protein